MIHSRSIKDIKKIIIHCSDSDWGSVAEIDRWHVARGFDMIGYHYVITNGCVAYNDAYDPDYDGMTRQGRRLDQVGAHCRGENYDSIGICLIGRHHFTARQLCQSLPDLLCSLFDIKTLTSIDQIYGHADFNPHKTCPNINTRTLRQMPPVAYGKSKHFNKGGKCRS
ncbi:MAG: N-acetylmuramoyl-L-alanine amidase [Desulfobacterales bacterium]|nr:N-acetylmuramoyl-L-alanine amidase [Desulfobacterales bacterium]